MTEQGDDRKIEREDSRDDADGRQTQRADDRDEWTPDAEKPQRKSDVTTDEPDGDVPEGGTGRFDDFQPPLESREYPTTTDELRDEYGDYRVDTDAGTKPLKELLEPADGESFGSPDEVRRRIEALADR
jgi:hypothetical protein